MNLDLLKKLVKLANHNPAEHEANSAARRVCKMIEENDFKFQNFTVDDRSGATQQTRPGGYNPSQAQQDLHNQARATGYRNPFSGFGTPYGPSQWESFFTGGRRGGKTQSAEEWARKQYEENAKSPPIQRDRKCAKCGVMIGTTSMAEPFLCFMCRP